VIATGWQLAACMARKERESEGGVDCEAACADAPTVCDAGKLRTCESVEGCARATACPTGSCFDGQRCSSIESVQWGSPRGDTLVSLDIDEDGRIWLAGESPESSYAEDAPAGTLPKGLYVAVMSLDGELIHVEACETARGWDRRDLETLVGLRTRPGGGAYLLTTRQRGADRVRELDREGRVERVHDVETPQWTTDFHAWGAPDGTGFVGLITVGSTHWGRARSDAALKGHVNGEPWRGRPLEGIGRLWALAAIASDGVVFVGDTGREPNDDRVELFAAFVTREGSIEWQTRWAGDGRSRPAGVAVDPDDGSIYVVGETDGRVGAQQFGSRDWFVSKLDRRGVLEWSKQWGTRGWDTASAVVAPGAGRVWIAGQMAGDQVEGGIGGADITLVELAPQGNVRGSWLWGTPVDDMPAGLAVGPQGHVVVGGTTFGSLGGESHGGSDVFVSILGPARDEAGRPPTAVSTVELPVAPSDERPPEAPGFGASARPFVVFRNAGKGTIQAWRPAAGKRRRLEKLPLVVEPGGSGTMWIGSDRPALSFDGEWLAARQDDRLIVARLDGSVTHTLTEDWPHKLISGFSPDSRRLLFHQSDPYDEETIVPADFVGGFYLVDLDDPIPRVIPELDGFVAWSANPDQVFVTGAHDDESTLRIFDFETRRARLVQTLDGSYGFGQPDFVGKFMAYGWSGPGPRGSDVSQLFTSRIDGSARKARTYAGTWAQLQRPLLSPDTRHLVYADDERLVVENLATGDAITVGAYHHATAWISPSTLFVLEGKTLHSIDVEGTRSVVATNVAALAVAGDPP
jgi:hypothetical protein